MNTSAYRRRNSTVSRVKKSQATIPLAWARRKLPPCLGRAPRRRLDPGLLQDRPDGAGRDPDTESGEHYPGSGGSPNPGSPAPAARSAPVDQRRSRACRATDADTSNAWRAATGANDESSPAARTRCPTGHAEASGPVRPGTSDRRGGSLAGPPADEAPRARDARRVARPRSRRLIGNATPPIRGGVETASRSMRWPPDDPADVRSDTPNRVSGTLTVLASPFQPLDVVPSNVVHPALF